MNLDRSRLKRTHDDGQSDAWASWLSDEPLPDTSYPTPAPAAQSAPVAQAAASRPQVISSYQRPHARPHTSVQPGRVAASSHPVSPQSISPAQATYSKPTPRQQLPHPQQATARQPLPPQPTSTTNVNISISLPKLQKPTLPKLPYKKIAIGVGVVGGLIIISLTAHALIVAAINRHKASVAAHQLTLAGNVTRPTFTPLLPKDKAATVAKTAAFDGKRDTYSYQDSFRGTSLLVSQQPIPANFDTEQAAVAKIAKSLNATTTIVSKAGTAYMASNSSTGAQTLVLGNGNGILVFVQSAFTHTTDDWKSYLDNLKS